MERGSIIPFVVGVVAIVILVVLHLFDSGMKSRRWAPGSFGGPVAEAARPLDVERNDPTAKGSLRQVRCAGHAAAGTRCWIGVR